MSRIIGLRNICTSKTEWFFNLYYDIDKELTGEERDSIYRKSISLNLPYILYKTLHGYHYICLAPLDVMTWANMFHWFKTQFNSYYSGTTIRLSRVTGEEQKLIDANECDGVIPNLFNLYATRFNLPKMNWTPETSQYSLVFEKYTSRNK